MKTPKFKVGDKLYTGYNGYVELVEILEVITEPLEYEDYMVPILYRASNDKILKEQHLHEKEGDMLWIVAQDTGL